MTVKIIFPGNFLIDIGLSECGDYSFLFRMFFTQNFLDKDFWKIYTALIINIIGTAASQIILIKVDFVTDNIESQIEHAKIVEFTQKRQDFFFEVSQFFYRKGFSCQRNPYIVLPD